MSYAKLVISLVLLAGTTCSGCASLRNVMNAAAVKMGEHRELAEIRRDTREDLATERAETMRLAAEREIQAARVDAERQRMEMEFCQANQEAVRQRLQQNIRDVVESKLAINVEQSLDVGELEVDVEELQRLLKEREEDEKERLRQPPQPVQKACGCAEKMCGCQPGLKRCHCFRCRHQCEPDCGGPEEVARLMEEPLKRPLRPAEIPLKLPVRLNFGMQGPEMERARIRREPKLPVRQPCDADCPAPTQKAPVQKDYLVPSEHLSPPQPIPTD